MGLTEALWWLFYPSCSVGQSVQKLGFVQPLLLVRSTQDDFWGSLESMHFLSQIFENVGFCVRTGMFTFGLSRFFCYVFVSNSTHYGYFKGIVFVGCFFFPKMGGEQHFELNEGLYLEWTKLFVCSVGTAHHD